MHYRMERNRRKLPIAGVLALIAPWAWAQSTEDLSTMSLENLMSTQVTSVSAGVVATPPEPVASFKGLFP